MYLCSKYHANKVLLNMNMNMTLIFVLRAMLVDEGDDEYMEADAFQKKAIDWANDFKPVTLEEGSCKSGKNKTLTY